MNFEASGLLAPGFHDCSFNEFYETFVAGFSTSQTRTIISDSLVAFSAEIFQFGIPYEFWVDGSYATTKVNPNDADIILFLQYRDYIILSPMLGAFRQKYRGLLDIYFACAVSPENEKALSPKDYGIVINHRNYWRGQFGFDRQDNPKGIIRIDCNSVIQVLQRR